MICFLTSSTRTEDDSALNPANGFARELQNTINSPCKALFICSDPDDSAYTDYKAEGVRVNFSDAGIRFSDYQILDRRTQAQTAEMISQAELIFLAGGHVPTQNRFFQEINLAALLKNHPGVLIGMSAGSMNSAATVYAHPELEGEAIDPNYRRWLPGLGLTEIMILPHYQAIKDDVLDGLRVFEDIAYPDSMGKSFYCLVDGSYLLIRDGETQLRGEAYHIHDGKLECICKENEYIMLTDGGISHD